jgi:hypothetical protein
MSTKVLKLQRPRRKKNTPNQCFFFWRSSYFWSKWEQFPPKIFQRGQPPLATALA